VKFEVEPSNVEEGSIKLKALLFVGSIVLARRQVYWLAVGTLEL